MKCLNVHIGIFQDNKDRYCKYTDTKTVIQLTNAYFNLVNLYTKCNKRFRDFSFRYTHHSPLIAR